MGTDFYGIFERMKFSMQFWGKYYVIKLNIYFFFYKGHNKQREDMGTRGYFGFIYKGKYYAVYNHWDSYYEGLGVLLLQEILEAMKDLSFYAWPYLLTQLKVVNDSIPPTPEDIEKLKIYTNLTVSQQDTQDWYCLLRGCQGSFVKVLQSGYILNAVDSEGGRPQDEAYNYYIDFDTNRFYDCCPLNQSSLERLLKIWSGSSDTMTYDVSDTSGASDTSSDAWKHWDISKTISEKSLKAKLPRFVTDVPLSEQDKKEILDRYAFHEMPHDKELKKVYKSAIKKYGKDFMNKTFVELRKEFKDDFFPRSWQRFAYSQPGDNHGLSDLKYNAYVTMVMDNPDYVDPDNFRLDHTCNYDPEKHKIVYLEAKKSEEISDKTYDHYSLSSMPLWYLVEGFYDEPFDSAETIFYGKDNNELGRDINLMTTDEWHNFVILCQTLREHFSY